VNETILAYEDSQLEAKYPDFKALVKEYRDGILLFELTDKLVWTKAVKDTTGLRNFYQTVKTKYMWPDRKQVAILTVEGAADAKNADDLMSKITKWIDKKGKSLQWVRTELMKDSTLKVNLTEEKYVAGENTMVDQLENTEGSVVKSTTDNKITWATLSKLVKPEPKALEEVKGLVTAEYQNQLEKEWIEKLRKQYPYTIDRSVLEKIK
jgi:peptidyl-prolyl cis-trans isomerase SurA